MRPDLFDVLGQLHDIVFDFKALLSQVGCDLAGGNRAKQMPLLVGFGGYHSLGALDRLGRCFKALAVELALLGSLGFFLGYSSNVGLGCLRGQTLGEQIISRISLGDLDNISEPAEFVNIFTKQNLHILSLVSRESSHWPTIKQ